MSPIGMPFTRESALCPSFSGNGASRACPAFPKRLPWGEGVTPWGMQTRLQGNAGRTLRVRGPVAGRVLRGGRTVGRCGTDAGCRWRWGRNQVGARREAGAGRPGKGGRGAAAGGRATGCRWPWGGMRRMGCRVPVAARRGGAGGPPATGGRGAESRWLRGLKVVAGVQESGGWRTGNRWPLVRDRVARAFPPGCPPIRSREGDRHFPPARSSLEEDCGVAPGAQGSIGDGAGGAGGDLGAASAAGHEEAEANMHFASRKALSMTGGMQARCDRMHGRAPALLHRISPGRLNRC